MFSSTKTDQLQKFKPTVDLVGVKSYDASGPRHSNIKECHKISGGFKDWQEKLSNVKKKQVKECQETKEEHQWIPRSVKKCHEMPRKTKESIGKLRRTKIYKETVS